MPADSPAPPSLTLTVPAGHKALEPSIKEFSHSFSGERQKQLGLRSNTPAFLATPFPPIPRRCRPACRPCPCCARGLLGAPVCGQPVRRHRPRQADLPAAGDRRKPSGHPAACCACCCTLRRRSVPSALLLVLLHRCLALPAASLMPGSHAQHLQGVPWEHVCCAHLIPVCCTSTAPYLGPVAMQAAGLTDILTNSSLDATLLAPTSEHCMQALQRRRSQRSVPGLHAHATAAAAGARACRASALCSVQLCAQSLRDAPASCPQCQRWTCSTS